MARLTWIIFAICVISCSAQFGFGGNSRRAPIKPVSRVTNNVLKTFGITSDDQKCFTLARRPFFMSRLVQYPCQRRQPGVPVLKWFMGPMGPICVSYVREPVYRYYRIPLCCPGYIADSTGKCSIKTQKFAETSRQNNEHMMRMASQMKQAMFIRARQDMARRHAAFMNMRDNMRDTMRDNMRNTMMNNMRNNMMDTMRNNMMNKMKNNMEQRGNNQQQFNMMPRMTRPPMAPMSPMSPMPLMMRMITRQSTPSVAFLRFNRPTPPMPRPIQRPPVSGRTIKIIKRKFIPLYPFMSRRMFTPRNMRQPIGQESQRPPVPRLILSGRSDDSPMARMREMHPNMPPIVQFAAPRAPQSFQPFGGNPNFQPSGFPATRDDESLHHDHSHHDHHNHDHHDHDGFTDQGTQEAQLSASIHVELPGEPVQMPDLVVEQAPEMNPQSCIATLEAAVKSCLKQSNINVPDVMSAFEPFNDENSRVLCEAEDTIFNCISASLGDCDQSTDGAMAREMLLETAQTVQNMCDMRQANVAQSSPRQEGNGETVATVENVDAIPTDLKPDVEPVNKEITIIEDTPAVNEPSSAEAVQEAIQHEVHVQEMRMKEYLLPILVGSGVGFMVLVLLTSLIICCCCKRRFRKKMKMARELEKPPLKDGIYTIGIPPPKYEVNGIPPLYYEEAKGEKITSRSPAVLEGSAELDGADKSEEARAEGTQM